MATARWDGQVIARSDDVKLVEGTVYFPPDSVHWDCLVPSRTQTVCGWKGTAKYFSVEVGGKRLDDAAWCYREPKPAASHIGNYIAFWKGVEVSA